MTSKITTTKSRSKQLKHSNIEVGKMNNLIEMDEALILIPRRKKQKGMRDSTLIHEQLKKPRSIALTDDAFDIAHDFKEKFQLFSRSESIEILLRLSPAIPPNIWCDAIRQTFS